MDAVVYSFHAMTWVTWLVLFILGFRAVISFNNAFKEYKSYEELKNSGDKKAIAQFYTGIIVSSLCVIVFFLPYFIR
jgi:hypothetical protein